MKKNYVIILILFLLLAVIMLLRVDNNSEDENKVVFDYKNSTYIIDSSPITLVNGKSEIEIAPGSASKKITQYFGNEATGDLNNDGLTDTAFIVTQNSGGSGTFYYVVASISVRGGYTGTNAILLGDRIAPQTTEIKDGKIIVNYAVRRPEEPMAVRPSLGVSKYFKVEGEKLLNVE